MKNDMNNVFANTNFADEAEYYIYEKITERYEVEEDVREQLKQYEATEEEIQEYTNKLMDAIEYAKEN